MYEVDEIATLGEPLVKIELDDDGESSEPVGEEGMDKCFVWCIV